MGKTEVSRYLQKKYPDYVSIEELQENLDMSRNSIYRAIRSLKKHDELQYSMIPSNKPKGKWKTSYRLKK